MTPVRIDGDAKPLGAPPDWKEADHGRCATLWVRMDDDNGLPFMRSAWEVTSEEAGLLLAGAKVQLGICAPAHPVVNLGLGPVPDDFPPPLTVEQFRLPTGAKAVRVTMYLPGPRKVFSTVQLGDDQLGPAVAVGIAEIEKLAKAEGLI